MCACNEIVSNWLMWLETEKSPRAAISKLGELHASRLSSMLAGSRPKKNQWKLEKANVSAQGSRRRNSLLLSLFVLFKSFTDWIRLIHIRKGNLLY